MFPFTKYLFPVTKYLFCYKTVLESCTIFSNTIKYIHYFISLSNFINNKNTPNCDIYLKKLEKSLYYCGPIGIKLVQNIIMYDGLLPIESINKLKYTLEQCKIHSWENTVKMYYNDYKRNITEDFIIDDSISKYNTIIGSGSIGQVYKLYSRKHQTYVAVKVKHPYADDEINQFVLISNFIIRFISYFINIPHIKIIHIFIDNISIQKNFINEANNTTQLRNNFIKDNIIVPEIYDYSPNYIVMSYNNGVNINSINSNLKYAIYIDMVFIILSSMIIYDFIHCDLHDGNWKIELLEDNKYNIILYDCGLVVSTNDIKNNQMLLTSLILADYKSIAYSLNNDPIITKNYIEYINNISLDKEISASERVNNILKYAVEKNIVNSTGCINLLLSNIMTSSISKINTNKLQKIINLDSHQKDKGIILNIYIGILEKSNKFNSLKDFLVDYVKNNKDCNEFYETWLFNTFGHKDSNIIIDLVYEYFYN
jgi:hypothetical protein